MLGTIHRLTILLAVSLCLVLTALPGPMGAAPGGRMAVAMARDCAACPPGQTPTMRCSAERAVLPAASAFDRPALIEGVLPAPSCPTLPAPQHEDIPPTRPA